VLGVGGYLDHGIRAGSHQQIVDPPFILMRDVSDGFRQCEDEVKVTHRQQLGLAGGQPCLGGAGLTLGAMAITA